MLFTSSKYDVTRQCVLFSKRLHIRSENHKKYGILKRELLGKCWYTSKEIGPSDCIGVNCEVCKQRRESLKQEYFEDVEPETYNKENDTLLREYLQDQESMDERRFYCRICDKSCFKEEFYLAHKDSLIHKLKSGKTMDKILVYYNFPCQLPTEF